MVCGSNLLFGMEWDMGGMAYEQKMKHHRTGKMGQDGGMGSIGMMGGRHGVFYGRIWDMGGICDTLCVCFFAFFDACANVYVDVDCGWLCFGGCIVFALC